MFMGSILILAAIWSTTPTSHSAYDILTRVHVPTARKTITEIMNNPYLTEEEKRNRMVSLIQPNLHRQEVEAMLGCRFQPEIVAISSMGMSYSTAVNRELGLRITYSHNGRVMNISRIVSMPLPLISPDSFLGYLDSFLGYLDSLRPQRRKNKLPESYGIWSSGGQRIELYED